MIDQLSPRYLITTADERTWKFDRPVIFLGEWCKLYDRRNIWQNMDAIVAKPYGLGKKQKNEDHVIACNLEKKLFLILCDSLNQYHKVQHSSRFWRIIVGHWLQRYVLVIVNRVRTLELCLQSYHLSGTTVFSNDQYELAPLNSNEAILAFNDSRWNNALYFYILDLLESNNCHVDIINTDKIEGFRLLTKKSNTSYKKQIFQYSYKLIGKATRFLKRNDDAFIINSYLPRWSEFKLYLYLGQVPQLYVSPEIKITKKSDNTLRLNLSKKTSCNSKDALTDIAITMLFNLLPVSYLEGFEDIFKITKDINWPKKPKFIFTSNNFDTDEIFKIWCANKIELGVSYFAGQHGNHGVYRNHNNPSNEEITADKFLTWGWVDGLPQHTKAFIFKMVGCKEKEYNPLGDLLLIELFEPHRFSTYDTTHEFQNYFLEQKKFVETLKETSKKKLIIRLHGCYRSKNWSEIARWKDIDDKLRVGYVDFNIWDLITQSRLVVHSYDSTGILETLVKNIPTLAFWQNDFEHLRDSVKPYYLELLKVGIIHLSPESVADKVNQVWEDVDGWWGQSHIQYARKQFCKQFAVVTKNPIHDLKEILSSN